jgi:hypothetical protein
LPQRNSNGYAIGDAYADFNAYSDSYGYSNADGDTYTDGNADGGNADGDANLRTGRTDNNTLRLE